MTSLRSSHVRTARTGALCICLLHAVFAYSYALADQNAPELPKLFDELEQAEDQNEATRIEALIWKHWHIAPDEPASKLMVQIDRAMSVADLAFALQLCNQLVQSNPDFAEAWNKRATLHYMLGDNGQSVADIRETIAREPRHFGAISGLGLIFLREHNFEAALDAFKQVLLISPASANAKRSVERVRRELGREI